MEFNPHQHTCVAPSLLPIRIWANECVANCFPTLNSKPLTVPDFSSLTIMSVAQRYYLNGKKSDVATSNVSLILTLSLKRSEIRDLPSLPLPLALTLSLKLTSRFLISVVLIYRNCRRFYECLYAAETVKLDRILTEQEHSAFQKYEHF